MPDAAGLDRDRLGERLTRGAERLGLELPPASADRLLDFLDLLQQWNRYYNLTAVTDPEEMVAAHLLDSLALVPYLGRGPVADVGTGAGIPGLILAVAAPDRQYVLLDRTAKKIRFIQQAAATLGLGHVAAHHTRVEAHTPDSAMGTVVARAFAPLLGARRAVDGLVGPSTRILLPKGRYPEAELAAVADEYPVTAVERLTVPSLEAERHLVIMGPYPGEGIGPDRMEG